MSLSPDVWFSILSALPNFPLYRVNSASISNIVPQVVFLNSVCIKNILLTKKHFKQFVSFKNVGATLESDTKNRKLFTEIRELNKFTRITDQIFSYFQGIHTLNMSNCRQETITDQAFSYLQGIHTLDMSFCDQDTITDQAFSYLQGIYTLDMNWCK